MGTLAEGIVASLPIANAEPRTRWFWRHACVVDGEDGVKRVYVGGALIGEFDPDDSERGPRNVLLVTLAKEPTMHFGRLASAFGIGEEYLRRLRRLEEAEGLAAVLLPAMGRTKRELDAPKRRELRKLFEEGWSATEATRRQRRGKRVSRATVSRERRRWTAEQRGQQLAAPAAAAIAQVRGEQLALFTPAASVSDDAPPTAAAEVRPVAETATDAGDASSASGAAVAVDEEPGSGAELKSRPVVGGENVQHIGTWIMMALAARDGLHEEVARLDGGSDAARIAIEATLASLAIGERTVEGVRRIATPTAPTLLRAARAPAASTIRGQLWRFAKAHGAELMAAMSQRYIDAARNPDDGTAVFYIDNHLRPYTGQEVVRWGWRMQDRRAMPGTTDYYVHDEDGRPLFYINVPSHDSLVAWLPQIAARLRDALGPDERIVLAFDRAGSYADELAELRDDGFEFVVYERKPFALLAAGQFKRTVVVRGEAYGLHEGRRANLGDGRGRVRRIALRTPTGNQINLLAVSTAPAERLVGILLGRDDDDDPSGRWQQENAFKHGVERWGTNQLDGRKVEPVPPATIIPNPHRRRVERALAIARVDEGRARCQLADLSASASDQRRARVAADLEDAIWRRVHLELLRPFVPKHAPVADTDLAGKLVRHTGQLKFVVDTLRIVGANVEADLAEWLAPHLRKPREAKKVIANLFTAPGRVDVTPTEIRVRLQPAANRSERVGIRHLLRRLNAMQLTLPADARRRPLRFEAQPS